MSDYDDNESKFLRKAKENPFVPVGECILCPNGYIMKRGGGGGGGKIICLLLFDFV